MIHALSEAGLRALRDAASRPLLYAFDFDGTLAPISSDRHAVTLSPGVAEWLRELAKRVPCAVVSGRALADVLLRTNGIVPHVIGNHGIESPLTSRSTLAEAERICAGWKRELESTLASELAARKFSYTRTDGSEWSLKLKDVIDRMSALEMAYNLNDCVELRWGAPDGSEEASTCKRHAPTAQRQKMSEYRAWFSERRRPPRG